MKLGGPSKGRSDDECLKPSWPNDPDCIMREDGHSVLAEGVNCRFFIHLIAVCLLT